MRAAVFVLAAQVMAECCYFGIHEDEDIYIQVRRTAQVIVQQARSQASHSLTNLGADPQESTTLTHPWPVLF